MINKSDELKRIIKEMGVSKVGFANMQDMLPDKLRHLKSGISIAIRLSDEIISHIEKEPTHTYYHHYRSVNSYIDNITLKISMLLQEWGYLAMGIPASQSINDGETKEYKALLSHKMVATNANIGWIGKSALLVTPEYGPRIRLGSILTNMELEYDEIINESKCGECNICASKCPSFAIKGVNWERGMERESLYDANACSKHMNNHYYHIGRGSVCGICVKQCPMGDKVLKR